MGILDLGFHTDLLPSCVSFSAWMGSAAARPITKKLLGLGGSKLGLVAERWAPGRGSSSQGPPATRDLPSPNRSFSVRGLGEWCWTMMIVPQRLPVLLGS